MQANSYRSIMMLSFYTILGFYNGLAQVSFAAIPDKVEDYYNVSTALVVFYIQITFILYIPMAPFGSWLLTKSYYWCNMVVWVMTTLGCWVKWLGGTNYWISFLGQIILSLETPLLSGSVTVVAQVWFEPKQRLIATVFAELITFVGIGAGLAAAPHISIPDSLLGLSIIGSVFTVFFIIFAKKDPEGRMESRTLKEFWREFVKMWRTKNMFGLTFWAGNLTGVALSFLGVIGVTLENIGISNDNAGSIGLLVTIGGFSGGLFANFLKNKGVTDLKNSLIYSAGVILCLFLWAFIYKFLVADYIFSLILGFFLFGIAPVGLHAATKIDPLINSSIVSGLAFLLSQISGFIFSFILEFGEEIGISGIWITLVLFALSVIPFLIYMKRASTRTHEPLVDRSPEGESLPSIHYPAEEKSSKADS